MSPFKVLFIVFGFLHFVASSANNPPVSVSASSLLEESILASMREYQGLSAYDLKKSRIVRSPEESEDQTTTLSDDDVENNDDDTLDELQTDPRVELNDYEQESDVRELKKKDERNVHVHSDSDKSEKTPSDIFSNTGEIRLPKTYNKNIIPTLTVNGTLHPIPVLQLFNIHGLLDFDETNEKITVDVDAFVVWIDGHLFNEERAHKEGGTNGSATFPDSYLALNPLFLKRIWSPDVHIHSLLAVGKASYMASPVSLKYNPKLGYVQYRTRIAITLKCPMEFQYYPADTQRCHFFFKSFSHFSEQLKLLWAHGGAYFFNPSDANFDIQVDNVDQGLKGEAFQDKIRTYDCLEFYLVARRKLSYHMVQTYIPSVFFIVITWLAFLLPPSMVEARIAVAMTTLLTLATMFGAVRESTPSVSYTKAIDIWMIGCILFVFLTLFEFALLAWLENIKKRNEEDHKDRCDKRKEKRQQNGGQSYDEDVDDVDSKLKDPTFWENIGWFIERFAFPIYSLIFFGFVVIYWIWLLSASKYYSWELNTINNKFENSDGWYVPPNSTATNSTS